MWNPFMRKKPATTPITNAEIASAKAYLNGNIGFDIDEFFAEQSVETAMNAPLGSTSECLSANEVARIVEEHLITSGRNVHLYECAECRVAVETYQAICTVEFEPEFRHVAIVASERIRVPAEGPFYLDLVNHGNQSVLRAIDPNSVSINGMIIGSGHIEHLDPATYDGKEAVRVQFEKYKLQFPTGMDASCDFVELRAKSNGAPVSTRRLLCVRQEA